MKNLHLLLLSVSLSAASCGKDRELPRHIESLNKCVSHAAAVSPQHPAASYAEFRLQGRRILMNEEEGRYRRISTIAWLFTTDGPVLDPSTDSSRRYQLRLGFRPPPAPRRPGEPFSRPVSENSEFFLAFETEENLSASGFIDKHIQLGDLKLRRKYPWDDALDPGLGEGFELNYWCVECCQQINSLTSPGVYPFVSTGPSQDGFLSCTKLNRTDLGDSIRYQIEFEFAGKLFGGRPPGSDLTYELVGKIEGGKMAIDFTVKK